MTTLTVGYASRMKSDRDPDRVSLDPLDPKTALKGLLKVDPESPPADEPEAADERESDDEANDA